MLRSDRLGYGYRVRVVVMITLSSSITINIDPLGLWEANAA